MKVNSALALASLFFALSVGNAPARDLSELEAFTKAVQILKGPPYGASVVETAHAIQSSELATRGESPCGGSVRSPIWVFRVAVAKTATHEQIAGYLVINARNGQLVCAGLPFLD
jgi:hypothetical protein